MATTDCAVHTFNVLTEEDCRRVRDDVLSLREHWVPRGSNLEFPYFYTLGVASYLDSVSQAHYKDLAREMNPRLLEKFSWLYQRLLKRLKEEFDGDTFILDSDYGAPGFHLYPSRMPDGGAVHFDLQYRTIAWRDPLQLDFTRTGSLTLAIELPQSGGGLRYWPRPSATPNAAAHEFVSYRVGEAYFHHDSLLHQIAPNCEVREGERRLTLQAHTIWHRSGHWIVYW